MTASIYAHNHGCVQFASRPTAHSACTLIDHVYTNNIDSTLSCNIITTDLSDHLVTRTRISLGNKEIVLKNYVALQSILILEGIRRRLNLPRFIVFPELPGHPPFSHIHGFTLDEVKSARFTAFPELPRYFLFPKNACKSGFYCTDSK